MKMRLVVFVFLLVTTICTIGSKAKNGNNDRKPERGRHGNNRAPGFHKSNGNKGENKKVLERDTTEGLDTTYGLRDGGSYNNSLGYERVLDRELTKNDRHNLFTENRNSRG
ncbi:uncharacterized protein LOC143254126 [Tachypleus tridentatus]|uniref:uncharacterized protein LOC143254126 n=1 Tax=Tachypleus tridentatus TaxID=6853 RepID=UPI003FD5CA3D